MTKNTTTGGAAPGADGLPTAEPAGVSPPAPPRDPQLELFRSLADHGQEFIGICDLEFRPFYVNEAGRRLVGLESLEEACAVRVQDFFFPEDQRFITEEFFPEVLAKGRGEVEIRFRHFKTGAPLWMIYNVFQVVDRRGRATGYATVSWDITRRKTAEAALAQERNVLRGILSGARNSHLIYLDRDFNFVRVNETYARTCGFTPDEMVGKNHFALYPDAENEAIFARVRDSGEAVDFHDKPFVFPDQPERGVTYWDWTLTPVKESNGGVVGLVFALYETTARKRAEAKLQASEVRQSYLLHLADALRRLKDPVEIQQVAARVLGEHLRAERVLYFEVRGEDYIVERDYTRGVSRLRGRFPIGAFGPKLWEAYQAGRTVVVRDVQTDASLSPDDRPAYAAIEIGAHVGVPLVKEGRFTAGLAVHAKEPREWSAEEVELIEETAGRTWAAVGRARAEQALRESEENYRTLFTSIDEGFCVIQVLLDGHGKPRDWRFVEVNPAFERHNGLVHATGKTIRELTPAIEEKWFEIYGNVALTGQPIRSVESSRALNRCFDLYAFRVGEPQEHKVAVLFSDISARKRAEEALRESEERFRTMADGTPLIIWVSDAQGNNLYVNRAYCEFFGITAQDAQGQTWQPLVHPEDRVAYVDAIAEAIREHKPLRAQVRVQRHDGTWRWIESCAVPRFSAGGDFLGMAGCCPDVTEQKAFESELQRVVEERTAKLQELVGELEHFSYTITHDLKSPLRAMRGFAEIADTLCERHEPKEFLRKIATAADRMDRLIADALNYSRSVRQELPVDDVDAGTLLRGMLDSYPEFQPARAQIRVEGDLPVVLANEAGLTQVFSNLLGNAVKFVPAGARPDVRIWASERDGWVRIWVEDKGIGISKEMLPRLFEMFSRGSKDYEGTGIGLALVRKVVHRMGGKVGVESEESRGSRFWIELKCGEARSALAPAGGLPGLAKAAAPLATVLYVEDEESDAMFMERAFAEKGMAARLRVVPTGRAAIDYLSGAGEYVDREKSPLPGLVLLDLNLPQISGFGVLEWMRNHPDYARTPVVIFSSSTRDDDRAKARALGADDFVAKPSSGMEFGNIVTGLRGTWLMGSG